MSEDWNPGGTTPGDQGQAIPAWQPPMNPAAQPGSWPVASVSSRWPLAILSIFFFWPLGIAACVFAARVKPALTIGDVPTAVNASNRVKIFFWISLAIFVLYLLILIIGAAGSSSGTG